MKQFITTKIIGLAVMAVIYSKTGSALATPVYSITNDTTIDLPVNPLSTAESGSAYYDYDLDTASGYPAFGTVSNTGFFWLHENTNNGDISLGMIFDAPDDTLDGKVKLGFNGVPVSGFIALADDAKDTFSTLSGDWKWFACCTDGGVIGGLGGFWDITITLNATTGIDQWFFLSGDPNSPDTIGLNFDIGDTVVISAFDSTPTPPQVSATPEPGTWMLLSTGLVGLLGYGWRKRRQMA